MKTPNWSSSWAYWYLQIELRNTRKNMILLAIVIFAVAAQLYVIGSQLKDIPYIQESGVPLQFLDVHFGYSPEEAYQHIEAYGPQYRNIYMISSTTLDMIYPVAYSIFFALLFSFFLRKGFPEKKEKLYKICFFPFLVGIADVFENLSIFSLLALYPQKLNWLASLASVFTQCKWILLLLMLGLTLIGISTFIVRKSKTINF